MIIINNLKNIVLGTQSPYTDNFIKSLIKLFLDNNCSFTTFYNILNQVDKKHFQENKYVSSLKSKIMDIGISETHSAAMENNSGANLFYENKGPWTIVKSSAEAFKEYENGDSNGNHLLYRLYLNLKGKNKADCIAGYINECQKRGLDYYFKFSEKDGRNDEIVITSSAEHLMENVSILQDLTKEMKLGDVPMLIGKIGNNIGISEEYYNRNISSTQARIFLVESALIKYLLDNSEAILPSCSNNEKSDLEALIKLFEHNKKRAEIRPDIKHSNIAKIDELEKFSKNIMDINTLYIAHESLEDSFHELFRKMYTQNPENFLNDVTNNIRFIGNNVFGISLDMVFSSATEDKTEAHALTVENAKEPTYIHEKE